MNKNNKSIEEIMNGVANLYFELAVRYKTTHPELFYVGYKPNCGRQYIKDISTLLDHRVASKREKITKDIMELITVWEGDTAKSVGKRVGDYLNERKNGN